MCYYPWFYDKLGKTLPCGGCIGCRLDKVALWSARAMSELVKFRSAFVTFTFDNYHLIYNNGSLLPSLSKDLAQKYLDNLRKKVRSIDNMPYKCTKDYKYYIVGEYGDTFQRPHYHCLFFGLDFADMSKLFSDSWYCGSVKSLPVNKSSIRYVLDYLSKNQSGSFADELYLKVGREVPFSSCSKHFGYDFFLSRADEINNTGYVKICNRFVSVPTYYKNLFCRHDVESVNSREFAKKYLFDSLKTESKKYFDDVNVYRKYLRDCRRLSSNTISSRPLNSRYDSLDSASVDYSDILSIFL